MIKVTVEYLLKFKDVVGKDRDEVELKDSSTVKDLINELQRRYGEDFRKEFFNPSGDEIGGNVLILVNDKVLSSGGLDVKLSNGDVVTLTYVVFGGCPLCAAS
ncbi:MAG: MoaD family protein [Sulfolobales archaeon]|nr:MoaD family protein [Sulfolobales archaeon]MCX8186280.1 MoaD family protein [Sulfolobales archaeon]MDW7968984.1 MoaD family protein [Sulfolobales archaeon]